MPEDLGERTEAPTARRLSEARDDGKVARSQDLGSAVVLIAAAVVTVLLGGRILEGLGSFVRHGLDEGVEASLTAGAPAMLDETARVAAVAAPALLILAVAAYLAQFAQVGWLFTLKPLEPKLERFDLVKGLGRLLGRRSWVKGGMNVLKLAFLATVAIAVASSETARILGLPALGIGGATVVVGEIVLKLAVWALLALLLIGALDYAYQRWQHQQDLKMTRQQVKDERRSTEGDPDVKARRMRIAREMAMQRLQADVPRADVVVTNPTHYAVALRYEEEGMRAPVVVAKGADYLAMKIRYIANAEGVPVVERPPLARALYSSVKVGQEIPQELYEAVAEVLAYVYRLEGRVAV